MRFQFWITDKELEWLSSYLTNREQVCAVNGTTLLPKKITCGEPQGSILGPLIILLCTNDLADCLDKTTLCLYVDDPQIFSAATDLTELNKNLNHDMGKLTERLNRNKLQHHPTEMKLMYIGSRQNLKTINCDSSIMIDKKSASSTCAVIQLSWSEPGRKPWVEWPYWNNLGRVLDWWNVSNHMFPPIPCKQYIVLNPAFLWLLLTPIGSM